MSDGEPVYPRIEAGRADIAELSRRARKSMAEQSKDVPREEQDSEDTSLWCLFFPVGWNVNGQPVRFELTTIGDVAPLGKALVARGTSEEQCVKRMRWEFAEHLMVGKHCRSASARAKALRAGVVVVARLDRRPEDKATAASLGRRAVDDEGA